MRDLLGLGMTYVALRAHDVTAGRKFNTHTSSLEDPYTFELRYPDAPTFKGLADSLDASTRPAVV